MADQAAGKDIGEGADGGDAYELDLDTEVTLEEAIEDAVAAVESDGAAGDGATAARVAELERELAAAQERHARTLADFDNFRKRTEREKAELRRYAMAEPLLSFVEAVDNVNRAMEAQGSAEDLKQGLEMTVRGLEKTLERLGVERIEAVGQPFDPTVHEAVAREESGKVAQPTVVAELQPGYRLHQRLLRPAQVTVAMPAAGGERDGAG